MKIKTKSWLYGILAILIILSINLIILYSLDFPIMAVDIIKSYWYLLILLIGGFGLQVGLFTYFKGMSTMTCSTSVVSGGIAGTSMTLCCSHYLLNILPFLGATLGFSALTSLSRYTFQFLLLGVVSNIFGIGFLFYQKKHKGGKINSI